MKRVRSILLRAHGVAISVLIAAVIVIAAIVSVRSKGCGARRRPVSCTTIDASTDCGARYRASCISISPTGNAVTPTTATVVGGTSVIAPTTVAAATTTPTCERVIWHEAGADHNECYQCGEGNSKHGLSPLSYARVQKWRARSDPRPTTAFDDEWIED
jgi:hypothetical protein